MRQQTATVLPLTPPSPPAHDLAEQASVSPRAGVRLEVTRRGRYLISVLAFLLGLAVASIALLAFDVPAALAGESSSGATVTVQEGETLWGLAAEHAPEGMSDDQFVTEVRTLNSLPTGRLTAGEELELPAAG